MPPWEWLSWKRSQWWSYRIHNIGRNISRNACQHQTIPLHFNNNPRNHNQGHCCCRHSQCNDKDSRKINQIVLLESCDQTTIQEITNTTSSCITCQGSEVTIDQLRQQPSNSVAKINALQCTNARFMKFASLDTDEQDTHSPFNKNFSINTNPNTSHITGQDLRLAKFVDSFLSLQIPNLLSCLYFSILDLSHDVNCCTTLTSSLANFHSPTY